MTLRYLFGPVTKHFAEQNLRGPRQAGDCLAFNTDGDVDLTIGPRDTWNDVRARLPSGWEPDLVALWLPYTTVPGCLWSAPPVRVGLATDANLLWHYYRRALAACDLVFTDAWGAERCQQAGIAQARPGILCGCENADVDGPWPDGPRDIDILLVGNLNPPVQRERMPWLRRLAALSRRWQVVIRTAVPEDSYRKLLARSRIVVHHSPRHKCGRRAFEAAAAGALVFQEQGNRELPAFFRDRQECVYYQPDNLEALLEHYLGHEDERQALTAAARHAVRQFRFEDFWQDLLAQVAGAWADLQERVRRRPAPGPGGVLLARCSQALRSSRYEDLTLLADLEKAVAEGGDDESFWRLALGTILSRQAQGRSHAPAAAEIAAEHFRQVLADQPGCVLAGLNLAEALEVSGQKLAAIEATRRTLEVLHRQDGLQEADREGLHFRRGFDQFLVEWERAAWANAGRPQDEARAKRDLLGWRLYSLLGHLTGEQTFFYEAALLRPDLPAGRAALGMALAQGGKPCEALPHLRQAVAANPLDRPATRALFQTLGALGNDEARRALAEDQRLLQRAVPALVPLEPWFADPRPRGSELVSIIVLCCNQLDYTRQCLESLLRHTRRPYEVLLVDNGSTDDTPAYLEEFRRRAGPARVEVLRNETNRGFPAGCNQALERARGHYVVFLNNDTVLTPGWLEGLVRCALQDWPEVGLVGPVTNGAPPPQGIRVPYQALDGLDAFAVQRRAFAGQTLTVRRLTGFCLLARRDVLERVGPFDNRFGTGFFEDDDLSVRAREAGFRLVVAQDVYVHHFGSRTVKALGIEPHKELLENFRRFKEKWGQEYGAGYHLLNGESLDAPPAAEEKASAPPGAAEPAAEAPVTVETPPPVQPANGQAEAPPSPAAPAEPPLPGVSLCMIVRNEEYHLPDCLRSVQGLFDEVVVVDTGSTDDTRAVARAFGAQVFDFPWVDSFGAARNEAVRHARHKWILWLDADDRLDEDNRQRLKELLAGLGDELDPYAMKVRSVLDAGRTAFRLLDQVRLFRNLPEIRWDYRIHEQILPAVNRAGGAVRWANVIVDHVGYQDPGARKGKLERNLRLLELDYADRPTDGFTLFNLGWTLLDLGRTETALLRLQDALKHTRPTSSTLRKLYHLLTVAHRGLKRSDDALAVCREGLQKFPDDAELLYEEGLLLRDRGELAGAEKSWQQVLDMPRGQYFASEEVGLRGFRTRQFLAEVYRAQERFLEAEVQWRTALNERPDFEPAWVCLGELYLTQARWPDLEYLLDRLEREKVSPPRLGWLRARGQAQRKEYAAARRTLEAVIARDPTALGPRVLLSQILLQEGRDWEAAEQALRDVLEREPQHGETRHNLNVLRRRLGREAVAV
jgi:GT2 family glycosyltransferase/Tfp pilus assembly protein PilF